MFYHHFHIWYMIRKRIWQFFNLIDRCCSSKVMETCEEFSVAILRIRRSHRNKMMIRLFLFAQHKCFCFSNQISISFAVLFDYVSFWKKTTFFSKITKYLNDDQINTYKLHKDLYSHSHPHPDWWTCYLTLSIIIRLFEVLFHKKYSH